MFYFYIVVLSKGKYIPVGFTGTNCEVNIDDCPGHICQNGAICIDGINTYTCQCPPTYTGQY